MAFSDLLLVEPPLVAADREDDIVAEDGVLLHLGSAQAIYIYIYIYINIYSEANTSCIGIICLNDRERLCITGDDICYVGGGSGGNITDIGC